MATLKLRDRDAIITREGLIFRVFGYSHPAKSYICDVEYAPSNIFRSKNPKALRRQDQNIFYKFYADEGWKLIERRLPQYLIFHDMLQTNVVGVDHEDVLEVRKPEEMPRKRIGEAAKDDLLTAMQSVLDLVMNSTGLGLEDFGVFGSLLHGFYHPKLSDIDLIVYGRRKVAKLRDVLKELYETGSSQLRNEFENEQSIEGKDWRFENINPKEYLWHQRRKLIYALFDDSKTGRTIKTEFEPVKDWKEIRNEYSSRTRILQKGWVRVLAQVTEDNEAPFIPAVYGIRPQEVLEGPKEAIMIKRIVSYLEEFRMQAKKGEIVEVQGNLEEVTNPKGRYHQIVLTYCPRYYQQVLKVRNCSIT